MNKYLIKLQPLNTFFFGQENKYRRKKNKEKENKKEEYEIVADYFQRSAYFPQQTALLGTLRYAMLQKNGQIPITNKEEATKLIGKKSFDVSESEPKFGKIKNISPVFIIDEDKKFYFQNPKDLIIQCNEETENYETFYLKKTEQKIKTNLKNVLLFENYIEKVGTSQFLINSEDNHKTFQRADRHLETSNNHVFIEQEKIGITKNLRDKQGNREKQEQTKANEEGFYKQIVYKLNKGLSFGFIAEIDDELDKHSEYVSMGADKSPFKMSFEKYEEFFENNISLKNENAPKIVLLSDAYLSEYNKDDFLFAISDTKTFRFLKTKIKTGTKYYSSDPLKKTEGNMQRSIKYNLIECGSVFFFEDEKQMSNFANKLKAEKNFYQIGYNHFKTIK